MNETIKGRIIHGKGNGKKLLIPTFNLEYNDNVKVEFGVFLSDVEIDGKKYTGITNIGKRPTVDIEERITIETHILDFNKDIYGKEVTLTIKEKIRDTKKFENIDLLKKQLENDIDEARKRSKKND